MNSELQAVGEPDADVMFLKLMGPDATPDDWDHHEQAMLRYAGYRQRFEACRAAWSGLDAVDATALQCDAKPSPQAKIRGTWSWAAAAMLVIALAAGFAGLRELSTPAPQVLHFATGIGEHRTVELSDRSTLTLGASTTVRVRFSPDVRIIELLQGQLLAKVQHNALRPFVVSTNDALVMAAGTEFDVRASVRYSTISVLDGAVRVIGKDGSGTATFSDDTTIRVAEFANGSLLERGQQVRSSRGEVPGSVRTVDVERVSAWQTGQLYFQEDDLDMVFGEVTRYTGIDFRILDPTLRRRLFTGSFRPDSLDAWLEAMSRAFALRITRHGNDWISVAPADNADSKE